MYKICLMHIIKSVACFENVLCGLGFGIGSCGTSLVVVDGANTGTVGPDNWLTSFACMGAIDSCRRYVHRDRNTHVLGDSLCSHSLVRDSC